MLNLTPHEVNIVVDGEKFSFPPNGVVARVGTVHEKLDKHGVFDVYRIKHTEVEGMPTIEEAKSAGGVIVSLIVLERLSDEWSGIAFAPDTSPNGGAIRKDGKIEAVVQFVTK